MALIIFAMIVMLTVLIVLDLVIFNVVSVKVDIIWKIPNVKPFVLKMESLEMK